MEDICTDDKHCVLNKRKCVEDTVIYKCDYPECKYTTSVHPRYLKQHKKNHVEEKNISL
jgi:hypothetical protein